VKSNKVYLKIQCLGIFWSALLPLPVWCPVKIGSTTSW